MDNSENKVSESAPVDKDEIQTSVENKTNTLVNELSNDGDSTKGVQDTLENDAEKNEESRGM